MNDRIIRNVSQGEARALEVTIHTLSARDYSHEMLRPLRLELESVRNHVEATLGLDHIFKLGSSTPNHAEQVARYLVEQGWTPPEGVFLTEPNPNKQTGDTTHD